MPASVYQVAFRMPETSHVASLNVFSQVELSELYPPGVDINRIVEDGDGEMIKSIP